MLNDLALFAGAGGGILGGQLCGFRTRCAVEIDPFCQQVLLDRQRDGCLPEFPIWDDIRTFDGKPWAGAIDVITGGFPCQDISAAGHGAGLAGSRSELWYHMLRVISEVRPQFVLAENSPHLRTVGLGTVLRGLTGLGYDCAWCVLGARHVGAPHRRDRMWILADSTGQRQPTTMFQRVQTRWGDAPNGGWWATGPDMGRVADGVADRVDRIRALGNGQVPAVAALAWEILRG